MKTAEEAIEFVSTHGVVLESARGPVPCLVEAILGGPIRGSWWSHPAGKLAFQLTRAIRDSSEVLVCRLVEGKVTYVHRRLWPALVRLSSSFDEMRLARVREVHSASGAHKIVTLPYPDWVTTETHTLARKLSEAEARRMLGLSADGQTLVVRPIKPHTHSTG